MKPLLSLVFLLFLLLILLAQTDSPPPVTIKSDDVAQTCCGLGANRVCCPGEEATCCPNDLPSRGCCPSGHFRGENGKCYVSKRINSIRCRVCRWVVKSIENGLPGNLLCLPFPFVLRWVCGFVVSEVVDSVRSKTLKDVPGSFLCDKDHLNMCPVLCGQ